MSMRRFQMMIPEDLDEALERAAQRESTSKAELLRRYAQERLTPLPALPQDPLWELVGAHDRSDDAGDAVDIDEVVYGQGR